MRTMQLEPPPTGDELKEIKARYKANTEAVVERLAGVIEKAWSEMSPAARLSGLVFTLEPRPKVGGDTMRPGPEVVASLLNMMLPPQFRGLECWYPPGKTAMSVRVMGVNVKHHSDPDTCITVIPPELTAF